MDAAMQLQLERCETGWPPTAVRILFFWEREKKERDLLDSLAEQGVQVNCTRQNGRVDVLSTFVSMQRKNVAL